MSQSLRPARGRYQRTSGGLVGAMVVTVLAGARLRRVPWAHPATTSPPRCAASTTRPGCGPGARTASCRARARTRCRAGGWPPARRTPRAARRPGTSGCSTADRTATSASRRPGRASTTSSSEHVDADADAGRRRHRSTVETWQSWTDAGGDYAVGRSARDPTDARERAGGGHRPADRGPRGGGLAQRRAERSALAAPALTEGRVEPGTGALERALADLGQLLAALPQGQ